MFKKINGDLCYFSEDGTEVKILNELEDVNERVLNLKTNIYGFDKEIEKLIKGLLRFKKSNVLLIGKTGVGKSTLVEKLALRLNSGCVPEQLRGKKIYELFLNTTISGTKYRGEFEAKVDNILKSVKEDEDVILFIDEIHNIMGLGGGAETQGMSLAETLKPYLARDQITLIGATTIEEYKRYIQKDNALDRRFYKVEIKEPSKDEVIKMLLENKQKYENHYDIRLKVEDIEKIVKKSKRLKGNYPDKAFDVLEEYCYELKQKSKEN